MKYYTIFAMAFLMATPPPSFAVVGNDKSAAYVRDAEKYIKTGDVKEAIIQLKNAVVSDPKNPEIRLALGDLYLKVENAPSAEKEYLRAINLGAEKAVVNIRLSKAYLLQRRYQSVLDTLKIEEVSENEKGEASLIIGNAHQGSNDLDKALYYYEKGEAENGKSDKLGIAIAQIYYFQKDVEKAEKRVDEALALNPKNAKGLVLKGELVNMKFGPEKSLSFFEQAIKYEPRNLSALFKVAAVLFDLQRTDEALEKLDVIYSIAPKLPLANYLSAVIYVRKNDLDKAEEFLEASGAAFDNFPGALILRGVINYSRKNYAQAIYHLNKMINIQPENIVARRILGAALLRQGDAQQAIKALMPVVTSGNADSVVLALLGSANMQLGKFDEGTAFFEQAVESKPGESKLKTQLALSKLASGDSRAALSNLQEVLDKDPNSKQAAAFMALISLREKNYEAAILSADTLIEQSADNPVGYNIKGSAFMGMKKNQEARQQFNKAIEVAPDYHSASMSLARLELQEGNEEKATEIYQNILKLNSNHAGALMAMARHKKDKKNFIEAEKYYQRVMNLESKNIRYSIEFSEFFIIQKKIKQAKTVAQQIIRDFPDHAAGYEANGNIDVILRDLDSAVQNFKRMATILGNNSGAYQLLARAQLRNKNTEAARKSFIKSMSLAANKIPLLIDLAGLESAQENFDQAHTYINQIKNLDDKSPIGYVLEGRLLAAEGKHADSLVSYNKASEMGATGSRFTVDISRAYIMNDQKDKAEELMTSWLSQNNADIGVRHILAGHYLNEDKYASAISQYEMILEQNVDNAVALNNVAWLYSQIGQNDKALMTAEKSYKLFPEEASFIDTYAWILVQQGQNEKGLALLQKAVSKAPNMTEVRYHLAVALKNAGRNAVAKKELEIVVSSGADFSGMEDARKLLNELSQ